MRRFCVPFLFVISELCAAQCCALPVFTHAFCRGGQVFLAWDDTSQPASYRIYAADFPILCSYDLVYLAERIGEALPGSAKDVIETARATSEKKPDPDVGYRLADLGPRLNPRGSLYVRTVLENRARYFALTSVDPHGNEDFSVTPGQNSLLEPVVEQVAPPQPIIDQEGFTEILHNPYRVYLHWATPEQCLKDGTAFKFTLERPRWTPIAPMTVSLHGYGAVYCLPYDVWERYLLMPSDWHPFLPYGGYDWWYGCAQDYGNEVLSGPVANYTERRLLWTIDWVCTQYPVDRDRVVLGGFSMGATGALTFGLRHPEIFAAISAPSPIVSPGLPETGWARQEMQSFLGPVSPCLPATDAACVWDRQDATKYVRTNAADLPFLRISKNRNDTTLPWFATPALFRALENARQGYYIGWGLNEHSGSEDGYPVSFRASQIESMRRNQPYIAITRASSDQNPGNGDPNDGDPWGQMGCGFSWAVLEDTANTFRFSVKYNYGQSSADVTPRRRQAFRPAAWTPVSFTVTDTLGVIVTTGTVVADGNGVITIPQLNVDGDWKTVALTRAEECPVHLLPDLPTGTPVATPQLVVTAALADRFYAELPDRSGAVEVLSEATVTTGQIVRIIGHTLANRTLVAEQVVFCGETSPIRPCLASLREIGDCIHLRNCLIQGYGSVGPDQGEAFTLFDGRSELRVVGLGALSPGWFVVVTGICRDAPDGPEIYGIGYAQVPLP